MEHYAGLELSLKEISICVVDLDGKTIARGGYIGDGTPLTPPPEADDTSVDVPRFEDADLWHSPDEKPFATIRRGEHLETFALGSGGLKRPLASEHFQAKSPLPPSWTTCLASTSSRPYLRARPTRCSCGWDKPMRALPWTWAARNGR